MKQGLPLALFLLPTIASAQAADSASAWQRFTATEGAGWHVQWSAATGTPSAIYGPGLNLGAPVSSLAAAREAAAGLLNRHADLLGKGGSVFVENIGLKTNRVYIFVYDQEFQGLPVISGRADVRLNENGVVALFGSRAVQIPAGFDKVPVIGADAARGIAEQSVLGGKATGAQPAPRLVVWGNAGAAVLTPGRLAWEVQIDERPVVRVGKAYVDAKTGALLQFVNEVHECSCGKPHYVGSAPTGHAARMTRSRELMELARPAAPAATPPLALTGTVKAWVNTGHNPLDPMVNIPLENVQVTSTAGNAFTDANGNFSIPYTGTTNVTVTATLTGLHTKRIRVATGTQMVASASVSPTTPAAIQFAGSATGTVFDRAQTTTYHFVNDVNMWFRSLIPTGAARIQLMSAVDPRVNINASCNAFYSNFTINFYNESSTCNMTAYETVIQHEWGHGIDHAFGGISQTDGLSEGWGDTICILRSRQPIVGPNFRKSGGAVRTALNTLTYPAGGGVHQQGQTWMGFNWDLRGFLMATHGAAAGELLTHTIVIPSIAANATNQPDAVREVFIVDDDDGNLNNGTPNYNDLEKAALKRKLPYPKRVNPNAGTYTTYGAGCPGSGRTSSACGSANPGTTANTTQLQNSNTFALTVDATTGQRVVTGFQLFTQAVGVNSLTIDTQIFFATAAGAPTGTPVKTGKMTLAPAQAWYQTTFATPLVVPANTRFFLSYTPVANQMRFPFASSGTRVSHFWHSPTQTTWNGTPPLGFVTQAWAWKVDCASGPGAIPVLTTTGLPELNQNFQIHLSGARVNAPALLLMGVSDAVWGTLALPTDLTPFGAPGCRLLASGEVPLPFTTDNNGSFTHSFAVPNLARLFGVVFFNQHVIEDNANAFGLVFGNAGRGKVGKQ